MPARTPKPIDLCMPSLQEAGITDLHESGFSVWLEARGLGLKTTCGNLDLFENTPERDVQATHFSDARCGFGVLYVRAHLETATLIHWSYKRITGYLARITQAGLQQ